MRTLSLFATILILCSFAVAGPNNSLTDNMLKGHVRSVTEYCYYNAKGKEELFSKRIYLYDEHGNELADTNFRIDNDTYYSGKWSYKYNSDGGKSEEIIYNKDGSISWRTEFTYDKNGILTESRRYHNTGILAERKVYKYAANGDDTGVESYNTRGSRNNTTSYKYDNSGRLLEEAAISALAEPYNRKRSYSYNDKGLLLSSTTYEQGGDMTSTIINNVFDNNGNPTESTNIHGYRDTKDTLYYKTTYSYY